jgi:hypothetical protein
LIFLLDTEKPIEKENIVKNVLRKKLNIFKIFKKNSQSILNQFSIKIDIYELSYDKKNFFTISAFKK